MTHTCDRNVFGICKYGLEGLTPMTYQKSEMVVKYNYAVIEIREETTGVKVVVEVKGTGRERYLRYEIDVDKYLKFKPDSRYSFCKNHLSKKPLQRLNHLLYSVIILKNVLILAFLVFICGLSTVIVTVPFLILTIRQYISKKKE